MTGECLLQANSDGTLTILHADPEIVIADEFLHQLTPPEAMGVSSEVFGGCGFTLGDGILTIHAVNGTVSYGLHSYDLLTNSWQGKKA